MSFTEVCEASELQETTCPPELCQVPESHAVYSTGCSLGLLIQDRQGFCLDHTISVCCNNIEPNPCQLVNSVESGFKHGAYKLFLNAFNYTWLIGLTVFALHLFVLGYLNFKSTSSMREISFLSNSSKALLLSCSEPLVLNLTQANRALMNQK
jgi:Domain of unknown function (DUF4386)